MSLPFREPSFWFPYDEKAAGEKVSVMWFCLKIYPVAERNGWKQNIWSFSSILQHNDTNLGASLVEGMGPYPYSSEEKSNLYGLSSVPIASIFQADSTYVKDDEVYVLHPFSQSVCQAGIHPQRMPPLLLRTND
jgi:hypothetical protein